ncbi:hypothetical protein [Synechococcus sp. PCC 7336]|uniref:hypothetical protein n=1 Tax=Synechococcus sp. PCC 7336 TaxID=195250 RepID=UPI000346634C|nr:hypothetical protein [Synechococcus sp. PCC 7336]
MRLKTKLVSGWEDYQPQHVSATAKRELAGSPCKILSTHLHQMAVERAARNGTYDRHLQEILLEKKGDRADADIEILALDRLFRKSTAGIEPIKRFVGGLLSPLDLPNYPTELNCQIDVFAYAFLKGAKNFDLLLDCSANNREFVRARAGWLKSLRAIEQFELFGNFGRESGADLERYRWVRDIVIRPSSRDERRVLASLLVSGPSMLSQISADLGLNYDLGPRTLAGFLNSGVVVACQDVYGTRPSEATFKIDEASLPIAIYCVRETVGLDLLALLEDVLPSED